MSTTLIMCDTTTTNTTNMTASGDLTKWYFPPPSTGGTAWTPFPFIWTTIYNPILEVDISIPPVGIPDEEIKEEVQPKPTKFDFSAPRRRILNF